MSRSVALRKMIPLAARQRAMTLVEVSMAIGIAAFAAIPIMGVLTLSMDSISESANRSTFSRLYRTAAEEAKTVAESAGNSAWSITLVFDHHLIACAESDTAAHYKVVCIGADSTALPGGNEVPAWRASLTITDLPKQKVVFQRSTLLVKQPVFTQDESAE